MKTKSNPPARTFHRLTVFGITIATAAVALVVGADAAAGMPVTTQLPWYQHAKAVASDASPDDVFGVAVAVSGDTMVVGATRDTGSGIAAGSVYIFERNQGGADNWGQVETLTASNSTAGDRFGAAVAISGDLVVVGAPDGDTRLVSDTGAAYVFERNQGGADNWGEVTPYPLSALIVPGVAAGDAFGTAVAVAGDTIVVGAPGYAHAAPSSGAAWVFRRNQDGGDRWGVVQVLSYPSHGAYDYFGSAVAIDDDTIVVGEPHDDDSGAISGAAWLYRRNQDGADMWGPVRKLTAGSATPDDYFGGSVAISGDTVVVGAPMKDHVVTDEGLAYVFARNEGGADAWGQVTEIAGSGPFSNGRFGRAVAIDDDTIVVGPGSTANGGGALWVFERNLGGEDAWNESVRFIPADNATSDFFGAAVALSGNTVVAGASGDDDIAANAGAAYVVHRQASGWYDGYSWTVPFSSGAGDASGHAVALSDDTAVIGAPWTEIGEEPATLRPGVAWIVARNEGGADAWDWVTVKSGSDSKDGDRFGTAVAISGDQAVIGAPAHNCSGTDSGTAYIFERNQSGSDVWGEVAELLPADPETQAGFGRLVAIDGDRVLIGADGSDALGSNSGAAYIFERNQGGADSWGEVQKLTASDGKFLDHFGRAVALSGDLAVVGAPFHNDSGQVDPGAVYLFERNHGGTDNWGEVRKLVAPDGSAHDWFGYAVTLDVDTLAVGASQDDEVAPYAGSVYIFERNREGRDAWGLVTKLTADDGAENANFGAALWLDEDRLVVGAPRTNHGHFNSGTLYVFKRNQGIADEWGLDARMTNPAPGDGDQFGHGVALAGNFLLAGAPWDDSLAADVGSVHIVRAVYSLADLRITLDNGQTTIAPGTTVTYTVTATNDGPDDVEDGLVRAQLDGEICDLPKMTWTCVTSGAAQCPPFGSAADLVSGIPVDLPGGEVAVLVLTVPVRATATGTLATTVAIESLLADDPVPANNSDLDSDGLTDPGPIFADGFESGDASAWSSKSP